MSSRMAKPLLFAVLMLCLVGAALYSAFPVSILPDVTFPRVVIITDAGERPARTIEINITRPIEEALSTIPNVKRIRSKTQRGNTEISVDFTDGTDILVAEQLVNARVNQVRPQLPPETQTEVERMNPTVFPVLGLSLSSKVMTQSELWTLATYRLKPQLARLEGVSRVVIQGGRVPEIAVNCRPEALAAAGLTADDVVRAIGDNNVIASIGQIDRRFQRLQVLVDGEATSASDIARITIPNRGNQPISVGQVAEVRMAVEDPVTVVSANGHESVLLNIVRQPSANSVAMVDAIQRELTSIRQSLPPGASLEIFYDQSVLIREAVANVRDAVLVGAGLAVLILLLFLGDLRATIITALIIPATVLITFLFMRLAGMTLNLMTLGALAVGIGLIIDDAIVVVENVFRHLGDGQRLATAVVSASREIAVPMISSTITTVVVFLPLVFLKGVAGSFFLALAITLAISLMVSLGLALYISPTLCSAFLKDKAHPPHGRVFGIVLDGYRRVLAFCLRNKWTAAVLTVVSVGIVIVIGGRLTSGFMPRLDEGSFVLDYNSPPGTSLAETDRLLKKVDAILQATPEVATFSRRTGTELGFAITEVNRGDYAVMLKENRHRSTEAVTTEIRGKILASVPGLEVEFIQVLQDLIGDLAGNPSPIEIKLYGEDQNVLVEQAKALVEKLGGIHGLVDAQSGAIEAGPAVTLKLDESTIGRLGLTTSDVTRQANAALYGTVATQALVGDRGVAVRVRLPQSVRDNPDSLRDIQIRASNDGLYPLASLGSIVTIPGETQTAREDQRRIVAVTAQLEGVDLGTAVTKVKALMANTPLPTGVTYTLGGQFESQQETFTNLILVLGLAVLAVFTVMLFQFRSFTGPAVILFLMPLSLAGAVSALYLTSIPLNVSSFMGAIMLAGIVVKNGILLLDRAQAAIDGGLSADAAVQQAGEERLRPILMTTAAAILGLLPLSLGLGAGAQMQQPLAIVVIGGLLYSTVLSLVLGPVLYAFIRRSARATTLKPESSR